MSEVQEISESSYFIEGYEGFDKNDDVKQMMYKKTVAPLWKRGNLRFLLDDTQLKILAQLEGTAQRKFLLLCSRRLGKSYTLVVLAFALCLRKPNARVLYLAPFGKDAADIVADIAAAVLETCPDELKPDYKVQEKAHVFKNGSIIRYKGVNGEHAQYLRGGACDLVILDECGIMDDLHHVLNDVVMPMVLTTGGRILLATTPPRTPGHDSAKIHEDLAGSNAVARFTILDNHRVPVSVKEEFLVASGEDPARAKAILEGKAQPKGTTARREYFCEFVTDENLAVLPEFPEHKEHLIKESTRPPHFDCYTVMDPGMKDRTGILYAYWDFKRGKLVIEDESLLSRPSSLIIAEEILKKEHQLWKMQAPYLRVSDHDQFLVRDLWDRHQIQFTMAEKRDSLGAINLVRNMIQTHELEINPRCKHLIRQCENAIWDNRAKDFARPGEQSIDGHFDLVAALKYLCRHVNRRKNPYPPGFKDTHPMQGDTFRSPFYAQASDTKKLGIFSNTPVGRRLAGLKPRKQG